MVPIKVRRKAVVEVCENAQICNSFARLDERLLEVRATNCPSRRRNDVLGELDYSARRKEFRVLFIKRGLTRREKSNGD